MDLLGDHCSMTERRVDDATREVADWLKCEYMQDHVGAEFSGSDLICNGLWLIRAFR